MSAKNSFGQAMSVSLFGESHGSGVGVLIDGVSPGIPVDEDFIASQLTLRRPSGKISTARREDDEFIIQSGVFEGHTTGAPLCIFIPNRDTKSRDYDRDLPRPSHADYTAAVKYRKLNDYRGGGHFSGRLTAALVAAGAIFIMALRHKGIYIATSISNIGDLHFCESASDPYELVDIASSAYGLCDSSHVDQMRDYIERIAAEGDSVGGSLRTTVLGLPAGLGEPWFDGVESLIARAVFGIPAVKGISFGERRDIARMRGSEANDQIIINSGKIATETNRSGGICGGITNGMPIIFHTDIKPTPSIPMTQKTVNLSDGKETELAVTGRHDPCIVPRARVVIDSVTALVVADMLTVKYGSEALFTL